MFITIATDDCLCVCDNREHFLHLKCRLEELFVLTLQEGNSVHFLNLRIILRPKGISIDQTDHIVDTVLGSYFGNRDTSTMLVITSPFPTDCIFETTLCESPILTGSPLHRIEKKYGGSLFDWNGILLRVAITTRVDLGYAVMRLSGYLAAQNPAIFTALDHIMRYLYFYQHAAIMYPHRPLGKKALVVHWSKGTAEYLAPEFGTGLVNSADADHAHDIQDRRSVSSSLHLLNGVLVACKCKNQSISTLHSTGSEIISLSGGVKKAGHIRDFTSSVRYPFKEGIITLKDNQGTIKTVKFPLSRKHSSPHHPHILAQRTIHHGYHSTHVHQNYSSTIRLQYQTPVWSPSPIHHFLHHRCLILPRLQHSTLQVPLPRCLLIIVRLPQARKTHPHRFPRSHLNTLHLTFSILFIFRHIFALFAHIL
jgi:hypothetical protein